MTEMMTARQTEKEFYKAIREVENLASLLHLVEASCLREIEKLSPVAPGMENLLGVLELAAKQADAARKMFEPVESALRLQALKELERDRRDR
jgi:hypothetical protein